MYLHLKRAPSNGCSLYKKGVIMAVIADYITETGCHIIVHDDFIQSPEENEKIIERVSDILIEAAIRRQIQMEESTQ